MQTADECVSSINNMQTITEKALLNIISPPTELLEDKSHRIKNSRANTNSQFKSREARLVSFS